MLRINGNLPKKENLFSHKQGKNSLVSNVIRGTINNYGTSLVSYSKTAGQLILKASSHGGGGPRTLALPPTSSFVCTLITDALLCL